MPYDLALSEHGDLVIAGNRDLAGISGVDLLNQRILTRLRTRRGEWVYDADGVLGSNLHRLPSGSPQAAANVATSYVREALQGMEEIVVDNVQVETTDRDMTLVVFYIVQDEDEGDTGNEIQEFRITTQTVVEAGE